MKKVFLKISVIIILILWILTIKANAAISASSKTVTSRRYFYDIN